MRVNSRINSTVASKRPVKLTLDEALVVRAKGDTKNLSSTVDSLLGRFVAEQQYGQLRIVAKARKCAENWNAVNEDLGSFAEEYSTL